MPCDGTIDVEFVYSRDGVTWQHADPDRTPAIPRGGPEEFDRGMIIGNPREPVIDGDDVHWYYTGSEIAHDEGPRSARGCTEPRGQRRRPWWRHRCGAL